MRNLMRNLMISSMMIKYDTEYSGIFSRWSHDDEYWMMRRSFKKKNARD